MNGDNHPDLLVGGGGEAYLVFGAADNAAWEAKGGTPDVTFVGRPDGWFGTDVAAIGDWNGDGRPDFAIGDSRPPSADPQTATLQGRVLIFYGRTGGGNPFGTTVTIGDDCIADVCLVGGAGAAFGFSLSGADDFDNDGRPDIAVGAPYHSVNSARVGRLYVLRYNDYTPGAQPGSGSFYNTSVTVDSAGSGFVFTGTDTGPNTTRLLGITVAGLGTWDATAGADLVVGATGDAGASVTGKAFFASGRAYSGPGLTQLAPSQFGFIDNGMPSGTFIDQGTPEKFATAVFALGNVIDVAGQNRPGVGDLGIWTANDTGFFIYSGDTNFVPSQKVLVNGRTSEFGALVCSGRALGDLDGDGLAEVCVAGDTITGNAATPYLWYSDTFKRKYGDFSNPVFIDSGSPLNVTATSGVTRRSVDFAGDLNGDGKGDLVVGGTNNAGDPGEFTILY